MSNDLQAPPPPEKNASMVWDIAMVAVIVVCGGLGLLETLRPFSIALGAIIWPGIGVALAAFTLVVSFMTVLGRKSTGDKDFSSLPPEEERSFVVFEKTKRSNASRSNLIGFGIAGAMLLVGLVVTLGMYSPCTAFCERAPSTCKGTEADKWKAGCDASCGTLEKSAGLQILRPKASTETTAEKDAATAAQTTKEKTLEAVAVSGSEYVQALSACSFANGAGASCEKIIEKATSMGLWCTDTSK